MKIYDSHTHLISDNLTETPAEIVKRANEHNVRYINSICTTIDEIPTIIQHSKDFENVFATVGVIPTEADTVKDLTELIKIKNAAQQHPKVVAIGEIGLDYYWRQDNKEWQKKIFKKQLEIAQEVDLPVNIHCREAYDELFEIIKTFPKVRVIMHCFYQNWETAKKFVDHGCWFSIAGNVTFKRNEEVRDMVAKLPIDKILVETDAPYQTPVPFRGKKNKPEYCIYNIETIAKARGMETSELADIIFENTITAFKLKERNLI